MHLRLALFLALVLCAEDVSAEDATRFSPSITPLQMDGQTLTVIDAIRGRLSKSGGTLTGPLNGTSGSFSGAVTAERLAGGPGSLLLRKSTVPDNYGSVLGVVQNITHTGGSAGYVIPGLSVISNIISHSSELRNFVWSGMFQLNSAGIGPGEHVAGYFQAKRTGGNTPIWSLVGECIDGISTAKALGNCVAMEMDVRGDGADPRNGRLGLDIVVTPYKDDGTGEASYGVRLQNGRKTNTILKTGFAMTMPGDTSFDTTAATARTAPGFTPVIGAFSSKQAITTKAGSTTITLTSALPSATSEMWIWVPGAGNSGADGTTLISTIASVSHTTLVLNDPATSTLTSSSQTIRYARRPPLAALRMAQSQYIDLAGDGSRGLNYSADEGLVYSIRRAGSTSNNLFQVLDNGWFRTTYDFSSQHIRAGGTMPFLSSCGTSPTLIGADTAGLITTGDGAMGCVLNFGVAFAVPPNCVISAQAGGSTPPYTSSATQLILTVVAGAKVNYMCIAQTDG